MRSAPLSPAKLVKLVRECQRFIRDMAIICPETVYQTDRVAENALPFIEKLCELVGYAEPEEEP